MGAGSSEIVVCWWLDNGIAGDLPVLARPKTKPETRAVMTPMEVARYLRIRNSVVYDLLKSGKLAGKNLGTREQPSWRILRTAVDEYLNRVEPDQATAAGRNRNPGGRRAPKQFV